MKDSFNLHGSMLAMALVGGVTQQVLAADGASSGAIWFSCSCALNALTGLPMVQFRKVHAGDR